MFKLANLYSLSNYISFILFDNYLDPVFSAIIGIGTDGIPALYNAVFNVGVISKIDIVQYDRVLYHTVVADKYFLKQN